jgi:hypothetical protein
MRIAFDLDDTLIPCGHSFPLERPTLLARLLGAEPLRLGAAALLRELRRLDCQLWVYTTSQRSPLAVWAQFLAYGVRLGGVVNSQRHVRLLGRRWPDHRHLSKYPPAFGVDLLIDDSLGVVEEGRRFAFAVLHVRPDDLHWADAVRAAVGRRLARV